MYVKLYNLGRYHEATVMRYRPTGKQGKKEEEGERQTEEESFDEMVESSILRSVNDNQNVKRSMRRTKISVRRYIKAYELNQMVTFTFAENVPISLESFKHGEWKIRKYNGKLRKHWAWEEGAKGERIQDWIYYDRYGNRNDLRTTKGAWKLFEGFIRKLTRRRIPLNYVALPEKTKKGVIHFHVATNNYKEEIKDNWKYGFVEPPNKEITDINKSFKYITKYIIKDIMSNPDSKIKRYRQSDRMKIETIAWDTVSETDEILQQIVDKREWDELTTSEINIYSSEQFPDSKLDFTVFHIS